MDAYPESISWYLSNPLFQILSALSDRIEHSCEKRIIEKINKRLMQGHTIACELNEKSDIDTQKQNFEDILTTHANNIFQELECENPLLKHCHSKIRLSFDKNKLVIKLDDFNSRQNRTIIRNWLEKKENLLNLEITIPLYVDINLYYKAIYG